MKKHSKSHAVIWGIVAILIVVMVYLMIDVGSASDVFRLYGSMSKDGSSNFPKSLVFLTSYTRTTGDLSLGNALGMDDDDIQSLLDPTDGSTGDSNGGGSSQSKTVMGSAGLTYDELMQAARTSGTDSYYSSYSVNTSIGNKYYFAEKQSSSGGMDIIPPGSQSTIKHDGCFMYATVAMASAMTQKAVTIENLCNAWGINYGYDVSTATFNTAAGSTATSNPKVGSSSMLQNCLGALGISANVSELSTSTTYDTIVSDMTSNDNVMYMIYFYHDNSKHWQSFVGVENGRLIATGDCWSSNNVHTIDSFNDLHHYSGTRYIFKVVY